MPGANIQEVMRFGTCEADIRSGELRRNGSKVKLQEQPFQVLALLLERPGEVVTREELRGKLWPADTFVDFEHSLNAAIKRLRDALGDDADNPRFVETLARRGYRFVAPVKAPVNGNEVQTRNKANVPNNVTAAQSRRYWWFVLATVAVLLTGTGVGWLAARHFNPTSRIPELRLTANASDDPVLNSVISPDGKFLAFADRNGLFLKAMETGETHSIALPDGFIARPVGWFPDGSHLLVNKFPVPALQSGAWLSLTSTRPGEQASMWSISVFGGNPHKIMDNAEARSVSPDGLQIAFVRGAMVDQEIWVASADGDRRRKVMGGPGDMFGDIAWSPESRVLAYVHYFYRPGWHEGSVSVEVCDPATNNINVILSDVSLGDALAWTPDGRLIYSLYDPPPNQGGSNLWAMRVDSATGRPFGEARQLTNSLDRKVGLSISKDGKLLTFLKWSGASQVYVAQTGTGSDKMDPPQRLSLEEGKNLPFAWTADNKSVLFTSDRDGPVHVFKQAIDQAVPDLVVGGKNPIAISRLNPDGSVLLYLSNSTGGGIPKLMRVPISGGSAEVVLQEEGLGNFQCARSPSTLCVVSQSLPTALRFVKFDPVNGAQQELGRIEGPGAYKYNWSLSPDGSTIASAVWRGDQIQFHSTKDFSTRTVTVQGWTRIATIDWAADGKSFWVSSSTPASAQVLLNIDLHGKIRPILKDADKDIGWAIPSPDGRHVALWESSSSANAWSIRGF